MGGPSLVRTQKKRSAAEERPGGVLARVGLRQLENRSTGPSTRARSGERAHAHIRIWATRRKRAPSGAPVHEARRESERGGNVVDEVEKRRGGKRERQTRGFEILKKDSLEAAPRASC